MVDIQYFPISAIQPIELHYQYSVDEQLNINTNKNYSEGINFYTIEGLNNYQDSTFNRYSCLALTSAISLSALFVNKQVNKSVPSVLYIQTYNENSFLYYDAVNNVTTLSAVPSFVMLYPTVSANKYQIIADGYYLYTSSKAPYSLKGSKNSTDTGEQYFEVEILNNNNLIISTETEIGTRFITATNSKFSATGSPTNSYILSSTPLSKQFVYDYIPDNPWVTYYMNYFSKQESKSVALNKILNDAKINYLIDFPYINAAKTGKANINISNLKTGYTPQGYPVPIDNFYRPQIGVNKPQENLTFALALGINPLYINGELITFTDLNEFALTFEKNPLYFRNELITLLGIE
jgi:hypothetical protein